MYSYFVKKVEFSLLLLKVMGRNLNVMFIFLALDASLLAWTRGKKITVY